MPIAAACYFRVSTDNQDLDSQKTAIRNCKRFNDDFEIVASFEDFAKSGMDPDRKGFLKLLEWVKNNPGGAVLVSEYDRLMRDPRIYLDLNDLCCKYGVSIFEAQDPKVNYASKGTGKLVSWVRAGVADYERGQIRDRMFRGKIEKASKGILISGFVPYGYRYTKRLDKTDPTIVINEAEANVVREIFSLYTKNNLSIRAIAIKLTREKKPTKKGAQSWARSTVHNILTNETYKGKLSSRLGDQVFTFPVPRIIDDKTWREASKKTDENKIFNPRNIKYDYLLSGLIYCGNCGKLYQQYTTNYGGRFARCSSRDIIDKNGDSTPCHNRAVKLKPLEEIVWEEVKKLYFDPKTIKENYSKKQKSSKIEIDALEKSIKSKERQLVELSGSKNVMLEKLAIGVITDKDYVSYSQTIEPRINTLSSDISKDKNQVEGLRAISEYGDQVYYDFVERHNFKVEDMDGYSFEGKREMVRRMVKRIIVVRDDKEPGRGKRLKKSTYQVEFTIPRKPVTLVLSPQRINIMDLIDRLTFEKVICV